MLGRDGPLLKLRVVVPVYANSTPQRGVFPLVIKWKPDPREVFRTVLKKCWHKKPGRLRQTGEFEFVYDVGPFPAQEMSDA